MKKIPSDFNLLAEIYQRYYEQFKSFNRKSPNRESKTFVPIDIEAIAKHFNIDEEIIFGRLYLHLEKRYGYKNDDGSLSPFFTRVVGKDRNAINFPLLASIIAGMREERNRQNMAMYLSVAAITVSLLTFALNGFATLKNTFDVTTPQGQATSTQELKQGSLKK